MHHTVLYLTSRTLENALKDVWICQPDKAELIKPSGEVLKKYHSFQRTPAVRQSTLEGWLSTSTPTGGGIVASIRSVFSSLAWWSSRPGFIQTPFAYTHCQIIAGIRTVGAVRVLLGIIDELRLQAETGSLDIALDVAASLVCAPLAESFARDQATLKHQQAINEEKPSEEVVPRNPASTFMSLRDALNLEHDSLTKETISKDEFRAQLIMRLFRRVSTLTAPPQPISHDVQ
ncbi:mediator complex subunit, partial [Ascosphaera atra]